MSIRLKKIIPIRKKKIKILFAASEALPFAKAGGLGDVINSLSFALKESGQDARVIIPYYGTIDRKRYKVSDEVKKLKVPTDQPGDNPFLVCAIKKHNGRKSATTYFLENMEYYEQRANVYGYADDHIRWALFCRGVLEFLRVSSWKPDVIVTSDWQTGLIPNYLKTTYENDSSLSGISTIFVIHNLRFQGMADFKFMAEKEKDSGEEPIPDFFNPAMGKLNWLLRGVINSDCIVTVSPDYAKEIMTPEFGEGLENVFKEKEKNLYGILNGIDQAHNDPEKSPHIPFHYSIGKISNKKMIKSFLQEKFDLPKSPNSFLMAMVSRLMEQKGFDLLEKIGDDIFKNLDVQMIIAGDGEPRYKEMIKNLSEKFPEKIKSSLQFDPDIPNLIFAGSDALLMPSKFEPCGITQMEAMRYGCIPIVRKTGGLSSTVEDFDPKQEKGNGFVFTNYDSPSLYAAVIRANTVFQFKGIWSKIVKQAMKKDFSWKKSAKEYIKLFEKLQNKK